LVSRLISVDLDVPPTSILECTLFWVCDCMAFLCLCK